MLTPVYTKRFGEDLKRMIRRGCEPDHIKAVMRNLIEGKLLTLRYLEKPVYSTKIKEKTKGG